MKRLGRFCDTGMAMHFAMAALLSSAAVGCTAPADEAGDIQEPSLRHELSVERSFAIDASTSSVSIVVGGQWLGEETEVELPVSRGEAVVVADADILTVDSVELTFEDITFGAVGKLLEEGGELSNLVMHLERSTDTAAGWQTSRVVGQGELGLRLGWSLRLDEHELDLADQKVGGLPFTVAVVDEDGGVRLELDSTAEGSLWSMPPVLELRRIEVSLDGALVTD